MVKVSTESKGRQIENNSISETVHTKVFPRDIQCSAEKFHNKYVINVIISVFKSSPFVYKAHWQTTRVDSSAALRFQGRTENQLCVNKQHRLGQTVMQNRKLQRNPLSDTVLYMRATVR